jgi:hypothetical protein
MSEWITDSAYRYLVPFTAVAEPVRERLAEQPGQKRRAREERDWKLFAFLTKPMTWSVQFMKRQCRSFSSMLPNKVNGSAVGYLA